MHFIHSCVGNNLAFSLQFTVVSTQCCVSKSFFFFSIQNNPFYLNHILSKMSYSLNVQWHRELIFFLNIGLLAIYARRVLQLNGWQSNGFARLFIYWFPSVVTTSETSAQARFWNKDDRPKIEMAMERRKMTPSPKRRSICCLPKQKSTHNTDLVGKCVFLVQY